VYAIPSSNLLEVPYHAQETNYFCGPASVQMAIEYLSGNLISQDTLAGEMKTDPVKGVTYTNMIRIPFDKGGYNSVREAHATLDELKEQNSRGYVSVILIWFDTNHKYGHYVAVIGYNATGIITNDPWPTNWNQPGSRKTGKNAFISNQLLADLWSNFNQWVLEVPYRAYLHMRVVDVAAPDKVLVGRNFKLTVSVEWSGIERLRSEYGPPYVVQVQICKGMASDWEACDGKALGYGPSKSGETVGPSGYRAYSIELVAPQETEVWRLTAFFTILNRERNSWSRVTDMPDTWREFGVKVTDIVALTVRVGRPGVAVSIDGRSMNTDPAGIAQFQVSITGPHAIQIPFEISTGTGRKIVFVKWRDGETSNSRTLTLTDDTTLIATYKTQYLLTVNSPIGTPQGSGWYDDGSSTQFSVASPLRVEGVMGILGSKYVFQHWNGDSTATTATASVTMDGPKTVTAEWRTDNTMPYITIGVIIVVVIVIVGVLLFVSRRKAIGRVPS
jgi:hypothetical protein